MRHLSTDIRGFTLIEVLVISPIIILFIGAFIALLVSLTGESLVMREKNTMAFDTQATLDDIEASATLATSFLVNSGTVPVPQGKNNSTTSGTPFTNETLNEQNTLIIQSVATTKSQNDPTRELIYTGSAPCTNTNPLYTYLTIYYVAADLETTGNTTDDALFKRTILPQTPSSCAAAFQLGSCIESRMSTHSSICRARDEKMVGNVETFDVKYFVSSASVAVSDSLAHTASDISINLVINKLVAGSPLSYTGTVRTGSVNIQITE